MKLMPYIKGLQISINSSIPLIFVYDYPFRISQYQIEHKIPKCGIRFEHIIKLITYDLRKAFKDHELSEYHDFNDYVIEDIVLELKHDENLLHISIGS